MATMSPLRRRMIEDMTIRNLSRSTQHSYIYAVAKFSRHFNCPPARLGMEDVRALSGELRTRSFPRPRSILGLLAYLTPSDRVLFFVRRRLTHSSWQHAPSRGGG